MNKPLSFFTVILLLYCIAFPLLARDKEVTDISLKIYTFKITDRSNAELSVTNNGTTIVNNFTLTLVTDSEMYLENYRTSILPGEKRSLPLQYDFALSGQPSVYISSINNLQYSGEIVKAGSEREYCEASAGCDEHINYVEFVGQFQNSSSCGNNGYQNSTEISASVQRGLAYDIIITNGNLNYPDDYCGIWVDWNQNEDFYDDEAITVFGSPGTGPYTAIINVPEDAQLGATRMRLRIVWSTMVDPCGSSSYGETEDYTLNIIDNSAELSGIVRDSFTLQPLSNATVNCGNYSTSTTTTGYYYMDNILPGTYDVSCNCNGYVSSSFNNIVIADSQSVNLDFYLDQVNNSPSDLTAELVDFNNIALNWQYEEDEILTCCGFYVYRNDVLVATLPEESRSFTDENLYQNIYLYNVKACYNDFSIISQPSNYATAEVILFPPANLTGEVVNSNDAQLNWTIPSSGRNLLNFSIYRNGEFIISCPASEATYIDENLSAANYSYYLTAVYSGDYESEPSNEINISLVAAPEDILSADNYFEVFPNPFNPVTTIRYTLQKPGNVKIEIFSLKGDLITTLHNSYQNAGSYTNRWNAEGHSSGIYMIRLVTADGTNTRKLMLLK